MRGVKHAGRWRAALARGEVLEELPVRVRRRRAADVDGGPDLPLLVGPGDRRRRGRSRGRRALVPAALVRRSRRRRP